MNKRMELARGKPYAEKDLLLIMVASQFLKCLMTFILDITNGSVSFF